MSLLDSHITGKSIRISDSEALEAVGFHKKPNWVFTKTIESEGRPIRIYVHVGISVEGRKIHSYNAKYLDTNRHVGFIMADGFSQFRESLDSIFHIKL